MVGGDPGAHQPVRRRQPFEDVDPHPVLGKQFVGGIHGRGTGPDDRDRQWAARTGIDKRRLDHRRQLGGRRHLLVGGPLRIEGGVERDERQLLGLQPGVGCDRPDRAGRHAGAAVDTRRRIDVEHLGGGEARLVR